MLAPADPAGARSAPVPAENREAAELLARISALLASQQANPFRARAYHNAAVAIRGLRQPLRELLEARGSAGLEELPAVGPSIASVLHEYLTTGQVRLLARLEGRLAPEDVFLSLPGIGEELAHRLHASLGVETLEELELAAHDGRLERLPGFGPRRTRALRELLAARLSRSLLRPAAAATEAPLLDPPGVGSLLALDAEYRERAQRGELHRITPQRFNPLHEAWLPILHQERAGWHLTALFSNSARAHQLDMTRDWVVIYYERGGRDGQCTVVSERRGPLAGRRVVRGRERECAAYYQGHEPCSSWEAEDAGVTPSSDAERDSAATVRALRRPAAYPGAEGAIETVETRMSWVFLSRLHAYKLKKPSRTEYFDYTTAPAREQACANELRLNRRLAANVYLDVVPVRCDELGRHIAGNGRVVDWLVKMRRLSREQMLDACIARRSVSDGQLEALALVLSRFYAAAPRAGLGGPEYRSRLRAELTAKHTCLDRPRYDLDRGLAHTLFTELASWIERHEDWLDARAPLVREAHGDLRPEHICLEPEPVIIDCLDFDRDLRTLDPLSELALLELECRRLGNCWIGPRLSSSYARLAADADGWELSAFYQRYHALLRASLAASRLDEPGQDLDKWRARASAYLELAAQTH